MSKFRIRPRRKPGPSEDTKPAKQGNRQEYRLKLFETAYITLLISTILSGIVHDLTTRLRAELPVANVGDRIQFSASRLPLGGNVIIPGRIQENPLSTAGRRCSLDGLDMTKTGGAATVVAVGPDGVVLLWAGGPSASGTADCGAGSQVLVANADYIRLDSLVGSASSNPK